MVSKQVVASVDEMADQSVALTVFSQVVVKVVPSADQ